MTVDQCFQFGKIIRAHGIKGEALVLLTVEEPENYIHKESVFVEMNKKLVPFFVKKITLQKGNKAILQFEDMQTEEELEPFLNTTIHLPLSELPTLSKGHFYYYQVVGYQIVDSNLGELGTVNQVYEMPGQDLVEMIYQNKEVLIPVNDAIVHHANHQLRTLYVTLPEGLLEIYITEDKPQPDDAD